MTKAARIDVDSRRELHLLKMLGRGYYSWGQMNEREKLIVLQSSVDVTEYVDPQEVREFRERNDLHSPQENLDRAKSIMESVRSSVPRLWTG